MIILLGNSISRLIEITPIDLPLFVQCDSNYLVKLDNGTFWISDPKFTKRFFFLLVCHEILFV